MVSNPAYNPNLLVGRQRSKNFAMLTQDPLIPLFNRATQAQYPPGSTFKTINTLIGLQEGVLDIDTRYGCSGAGTSAYRLQPQPPRSPEPPACHRTILQPLFLAGFQVNYRPEQVHHHAGGLYVLAGYVASFGVGSILEGDIPDQANGNLPKDTYFDRYYGKKGWRAITIRSLSIGQGEIEDDPASAGQFGCHYCQPGLLLSASFPEGSRRRP